MQLRRSSAFTEWNGSELFSHMAVPGICHQTYKTGFCDNQLGYISFYLPPFLVAKQNSDFVGFGERMSLPSVISLSCPRCPFPCAE